MVEHEKLRKKRGTNEKQKKKHEQRHRKYGSTSPVDAVKRRVTYQICKNGLAWHGSLTYLHEHRRRKHVGVEAGEEEPARVLQHRGSECSSMTDRAPDVEDVMEYRLDGGCRENLKDVQPLGWMGH
ncbi:hypothetical protein ILYODFUR_008759 [Ilyodon furcidens]|uniref:Uncharacterized protein n=1 Tax=Ilyodon furcidens TaxID=33524 RepID=A0ABV0V4E2_9TELE